MAEIRRRVRVTREVEIVGATKSAVEHVIALLAQPAAYPWAVNRALVDVAEKRATVEPVEPKRGKRGRK